MPRTIHIAAALIARSDQRVLLVRKAGTTAFMQPGGKLEPGETPLQAMLREVEEELGVALDPSTVHPFGHFSAPAANEADAIVEADVFFVPVDDIAPVARLEIAEVRWVDPFAPGELELAPLTGDEIFPAARIFLNALGA